jgi:hypothetical protein
VRQLPFGIATTLIFAGFNTLLLLVTGLLMAFPPPMTGPAGWRIAGGLMLTALGGVFCAAIYGMWRGRTWGRHLARAAFLACIPLNAAAIFPLFQNHRTTMGNTLLQIACIVASVTIVLYLSRIRLKAPVPEAARQDDPPPRAPAADTPEDPDQPFTFDRDGRADRL